MLTAHGTSTRGSATFASRLVLERRFRVHAVERTGTVWDSRFAPAVERADDGAWVIYVLDAGTLVWDDGPTFVGPSIFVARESELEGASGVRARTFRSHGEPLRSLELRIGAADLAEGTPLRTSLAAPPELFGAGRELARAIEAERDATAPLRTLLEILHARGILREDLARTIVAKESEHIERTWNAIRGMYRAITTNPSLTELASGAQVSVRQVARDFDDLQTTFPIHGDGWRSAIQTWRFRWAILLLSVAELRVLDVAEIVGYGSAEAMTNAFRTAGMLPPTKIREALIAR
jgi:AraC-like DNA-binding protein